MLEGRPQSYWMTSSPATSYPVLTEAAEVDVAVVGGGVAGLSTAAELARAGRSVMVLEADRIAAGVTGYTTGRLSSAHPWIYGPLRDALGPDAARLYARSQQEAVEQVGRTARELEIDCELERRPSHVYVESPDRVDELKAETEAVQEAGLPASFVTDTDLPYEVAGAMRVEEQAQFHPRRYLIGLAEDIVRRGGRIHERTRVVELSEGRGHRLTTGDGVTVTAREVVIATLFPIVEHALLSFRLTPLRELVVTAPIPEEDDPGAMYITRQENTRSVRTAPYRDGRRLLLVTGESYAPGNRDVADHQRRLVAWTREHFKIGEIVHWWSAQDLDTAGKVPYVGRIADRLYVATGYARSGMSHGVMSGRLLAGLITGDEPEWAYLYDPRRAHPVREAGPVLSGGMTNMRRFIEDRVRTQAGDLEDIPPGSGAVIRHRGRHCAAYRDEDGTPHLLSARCPHLACLVAFNGTERVWECPCHGSRFDLEGTVLQGPATSGLARIEPGPGPEERN
ncbi:FAD-dependent oxidoreductase [Actinomadura viridis]|uniref:Glycine/D-amino acid oxidase-like deaminating enzyme/nitrite reductase/ring-hydroxylating ferredoxin subunit n=1 Tax=Actinomadura viridis TaxID=58110 RepID=A0A931GPF6_9ACTN|nr:FAD-dependent oxidoreductase [Actinomadura viridis]MBG6093860.1 glycine/D-amino acid oxidase-like deaminating enzyme/nitrite reductase/ring-hydroxylating ferredoxin subunit [Actinomadura viridis]